MTYIQSLTTVTLLCDGEDHPFGVRAALVATLTDGEDHLNATQRLWSSATRDRRQYWTSTSTDHLCPACTERRRPGNPTADI